MAQLFKKKQYLNKMVEQKQNKKMYANEFAYSQSWSSLEEVDEQTDRPKSQRSMECCHVCAA